MFLMLSRILSRLNCILILVIFNHASSAPLKSPFRSDQGFSTSPKILEFQLPFKISSKEDLLAWSKYVTGLMTSKINLPSILKNSPLVEKLPFMSNSDSKSKEMMKKTLLSEKRQGVNYPARRLKEPHMQRADEKVVAYPLPIGAMKSTTPKSQDPSSLSTSNFNGPADFGQYTDFNVGNPFQQSEIDTFGNFDFLLPPANTYLPLPPSPIDTVKPYQNVDKNISSFEEPAKLQTMRNSLNFHNKVFNNEFGQASPLAVNNGLTGINLSHTGEPLLTFPFQAVITFDNELPAAMMTSKMQSKDHTGIEDLPNEFLPYFEQSYTLMNESGQVRVFNDFTTDVSETKTRGNVRKEKGQGKEQNIADQKKQNQKKMKSSNKQKSSAKRQSSVLGDLLRMLGILRKLPKNSTEINVATPVLSILKGTNSQKIQVAFEETPPNRGRRNETFLAQQLDEDDENDNDGNDDGNDNGDGNNNDDGNDNDENGNDENDNDENGDGNNNDENEPQTEAQEDEDEEEEGGSVQAVIDLLPLAAPLLEELSDPNAQVDIVELLQGAIPLLEGLSDPEEEGGFDIPSVLLPLFQKFSQGQEGQASDSGAILGPLIQLIAPLIGPLSGPLLGPLSRTSSGPNGAQGSASIFTASAEPLSKPQGPYGQSVLSGLIASITAKLSKESAASAGDSDVKSLVSSIVSGVLAGASAGSSGYKGHYGYNKYGNNNNNYGQSGNNYGQNGNRYGQNGNRDTSQSSTSYDSYHSYGYKPPTEPPSSFEALAEPFKEVLGAFLKLSATSSTHGANLSGGSSSSSAGLSASASKSSEAEKKPTYGPPAYGAPAYGAPTYPSYAAPSPSYAASPYAAPLPSSSYAPPSTKSSYVSYTRRQTPRQKVKKL